MIHIRTWTGSGSATVTDMANAGKRGKTCRQLRFSGWLNNSGPDDSPASRAHSLTLCAVHWLDGVKPDANFDAIANELRQRIVAAELPENYGVFLYADETIKAIDAPKPELAAGVSGLWSARANSEGILLLDHEDQNNLPAECTHKQTNAQAYKLASKVWENVKQAKTFNEASKILTSAGCRLHYWCRMD